MNLKDKIQERILELTRLDNVRLGLPDRIVVSTEKDILKWVLSQIELER